MSRQSKEPTWPFLCILACLFVLSAAAPRAWEKRVRTGHVVPNVAEINSGQQATESADDELASCDAPENVASKVSLTAASNLKVLLNTPMPPVRPTAENDRALIIVVPSPRIANRFEEPTEGDLDAGQQHIVAVGLEMFPPYPRSTDSFLSEETDAFSFEESDLLLTESTETVAAENPKNAALEESDIEAGLDPQSVPAEGSEIVSTEELKTTVLEASEIAPDADSEKVASDEPEIVTAVESDTMIPDASEIAPDADSETVTAGNSESAPVEETASEVDDDRDMSAVVGVSVLSSDEVARLAAEAKSGCSRFDARAEWTVPVSVFEQLEPLSWDCETGKWARDVADMVSRVPADLIADPAAAKQSVERIRVLGRDGVAMAKEMEGTEQFVEMRRALMTLHREVSIWDQLAETLVGDANQPKPIDWERVVGAIEQMQTLTTDAENGAAWDSFLELKALAEIAARAPEAVSDKERMLARVVLLKLQVKDVTAEQRTFLESQEVSDFKEAVTEIVTEPVNADMLLTCLEAFERTGSQAAAEALGLEHLKLSLSSLPAQLKLASRIEKSYLGANVRIAVTGYLLNRMLPDREPEYQWVRDTVLGTPVRGRSRISTQVGVSLIPDSERMRAALTVDGFVSASTSSTAGPATFFNDSESDYYATKEFELTPMGIVFQPAEVKVDNKTRLRKIETDFDGIPLISSLVQSVARSQHDLNRLAIRREMTRKVQYRAETQIDEEVDARLGELNERLKQRLLDPLAAMSLRPEVSQAETTAARMSMQLQLAGPVQLGSHTPRPWAPSDSVLSFQIHQSALNNVLSGLELDGATLTIKELRERIAERFNRPELLEETTEHDDVSITFAPRDAARVDFQDGRIAVELGISRLRAQGRLWRDFRVRAYYRPEMSRHSASLNRDGVVELIGRLRVGAQIALRGIFSKTFAKNQTIPVVPAEMTADPRLKGLEVTQLTADDGWFALAVGPERIQPAMANGPSAGTVK